MDDGKCKMEDVKWMMDYPFDLSFRLAPVETT